MAFKTLFSCLALLAAVATAEPADTPSEEPVSYDGFKVFRVPVTGDPQRINDVVSQLNLAFWQPASRKDAFADIEVPPDSLDAFNKEMETDGIQVTVMHEDLGKSISDEATYSVYAEGSANDTWFTSYHSYADHLQWLKDLQSKFPNNSEVVSSGKSLQDNDISGIHLFGSSGKGTKPAIVFHGTVHAREWISSMVVEYFAYTLASNYSTNNEIASFVDKYDFYLFPIVNPDGFKYTQTTNRMWRKNRQTTNNSPCIGHDINRNWPYQWDGPGSSQDPCAEDFRGESPGDAPETKSLTTFIQTVKGKQGLKLYIDWHSYSQLFMSPYGYTSEKLPANNDELQNLMRGVVEAIRGVYGTEFDFGPICTTIYPAAGSSVDWVTDVAKGDYVFTSELRDRGRFGFVLPADQIIPSGQEAFAGVKYLLTKMK
ncbi:hypothetical protein CDD82_5244 [Ophiocordyceps australis]|uniref:Peptidase M14 domain-containing protein n=1 Tax=Ophiocordyceps australis TaxID=1399860 RepID=A0A2C5XIP8_9HYPO|nr:hypothetical protein CDD82_5244 [Ophiocordyceps australis]